jgi:hypothetical protein
VMWADRLRPRSCRGAGKAQVGENRVNALSVERSYGIWDCEANDFRLCAGRHSCDGELAIAVVVMRQQRRWTSDWGLPILA